MKLFGSPRSPYVRKVRLVLHEKKIPYEMVQDRTMLPDANPLAKVPTLILASGKAIYDSPVIVEYLDGIVPEPKLIPITFDARIEVKRWEALGDGVADATVAISHERRKPAEKQESEEWYAKQRKKIDLGLVAFSRGLSDREFCYGNAFSLADVAVAYALGYIDRVLQEADWRKAHPNLERFFERCSNRESFQKTQHE